MVEAHRTLILFRHAKSTAQDDVADRDRPLNERGKSDAPAAGRWLREHVPNVELVVSSPARRTRETWKLAAPHVPASPSVRYTEDVYAANAADLVSVVRNLPTTPLTVLLMGHNPALSELIGLLTGKPTELGTSGIAVLRSDQEWARAGDDWAELAESAKPRG